MSTRVVQAFGTAPVLVGFLAATLALLPCGASPAGAQDAQIQSHLAAGEFAPALALAGRMPAGEDRDEALTGIAIAQARVGAREASLRTAAEISDDRVLTRALSGMSSVPVGGRGGAAMADFQSLIDLVVSTVEPTSWEDVGGPGSIAPFPTGVYVDPQGVLEPLLTEDIGGRLQALRRSSALRTGSMDPRRASPIRKISLTRLERQIQLLGAAGRAPTETMQVLAGLQRIRYVFVYPDSGDLVLAGPAGDWAFDPDGRVQNVESGGPVVLLDDLVVVLRQMMERADAQFGCMINPTQEGLASTQAFLDEWSGRSVPVGSRSRRRWLDQLRSRLGQQDIEVFGLDPRTRAARVMVEADYRMKLVGIGLEEGVPGVESYLDSVDVPPGQAPPPLGVLRWWFTLNYDAILATRDGNAFELRGPGVQVLSENERLAADGTRIHTGQSEQLNQKFARSFTQHFEALSTKYPIYAELRNLFDLALVLSLIRQQELAPHVGWHMTCFGDPGAFPVRLGPEPKQVETVINHRVVNKVHILAGVSGGVLVKPAGLVAGDAIQIQTSGPLYDRSADGRPADVPSHSWWWD